MFRGVAHLFYALIALGAVVCFDGFAEDVSAQEILDSIKALRRVSTAKETKAPQMAQAAKLRIAEMMAKPSFATAAAELAKNPSPELLEHLAALAWTTPPASANTPESPVVTAGYRNLEKALGLGTDDQSELKDKLQAHQKTREEAVAKEWKLAVEELHRLSDSEDYPDPKVWIQAKLRINKLVSDPALRSSIEGRADGIPVDERFRLNQVILRALSESPDEKRLGVLLEEVGFERLIKALGLADRQGPLYQELKSFNELMRFSFDEQAEKAEKLQDNLLHNAALLRRGSFLTTLALTGAAFVGVGKAAYNWLGFNRNFYRALGSWAATWVGASVGSFGLWYPSSENWLSKLFLRKSRRALLKQLTTMLDTEPDRALPYVRELADAPLGSPYTPTQNIAMMALRDSKNPAVTKALLEIAIKDITQRNYGRAKEILQEVLERERVLISPPGTRKKNRVYHTSDRGVVAQRLLESLDALGAFTAKKVWQQTKFTFSRGVTGRKVAILLGALGVSGYYLGNHLEFWVAISSGVGLAGARALIAQLVPQPDKQLYDALSIARDKFFASLDRAVEAAHGLPRAQRMQIEEYRKLVNDSDVDRAASARHALKKANACPEFYKDIAPSGPPATASAD